MFYYDGAGMWVDSEGSARGCDTSCVWVLLPRDHGPERGVALVPRCCWCCGAGRTLPAPCPWSPREEPPGSRPPQGWERGGEPLLPLGTTKTLPLHPRLSPPDRTLGCGCVRAPCAPAAPALGALPVLSQGSPRGAGAWGRRELQGLQLGAVGAAAACGCASAFGTLWSCMTPRLPIMACFSNKTKGFIFFLCH